MFMTLLHFTMSLKDLVVNLVGLSMMGLVAVGYKTKLVSLVMVCWLLALNCLMNDFWRHRSTSIMWDFKKYDFFQVNRLFMVACWNHTERLNTIFATQIVSSNTLSNRREWPNMEMIELCLDGISGVVVWPKPDILSRQFTHLPFQQASM